MRKKREKTFITVPATPVIRKTIGLSTIQCAAKFLGSITSGLFGCINLEILCGGEWDFVPARNERELDTLVISLKFNEHRDFLMSTIRSHINTCRVRYAVEDNYRDLFRNNVAESAQEFFYDFKCTT